jgi:16S rRNA (cytosine1402-N4)-methyltransferase
MHTSFLEAADRLIIGGNLVDMILLDLGVSSPQLDNAERGFSFKADAPLDMRMDQTASRTAADIVNKLDERSLAKIIREYGEEPKANAVARAIIAARPITRTLELAKIVRRVAAPMKELDSSTRTFQAIRIATNSELEQLEQALPKLVQLLTPNGRLAVISFHSLEDRIVKQFFDRESRDCICPPKQPVCTCGHTATLSKLTAKPIVADPSEIVINPRARSAKLRAAEKQNQNKRSD